MNGQRMSFDNISQIVDGQRYATEKVFFSFKIASVAIGSHGLHDSNEDIAPEVVKEFVFADGTFLREAVEVVDQKFLTDGFGNIAFGTIEQRGNIILSGSSPTPLEIDVIGGSVFEHDVARLEVAVEKEIAVGRKQEFDKAVEVPFQQFFVELYVFEFKEIVFEIIEIPLYRLGIKGHTGIGIGEIHVATCKLDVAKVG